MKTDKLKLGELYEKWQKKTNRSIGRDGVFDTPTNNDDDDYEVSPKVKGKGKGSAKKGKNEDRQMSAQAIKMDRDRKQDMKMKNMNKGDRKRLERTKKGKSDDKTAQKKGFQGKKGMSGRWKR